MKFLFYSLVTLLLLITSYQLPATSLAHSQTQIIKMTAEGFLPQNLTLDNNSTVIFLNDDSRGRWPASNTHPTHDLYPEFDPKKIINPGQSWAFKPKRAGTFKFHDHLYPHFRGTLEITNESSQSVLNSEQVAETEFSWIDKLKTWFNDISQKVISIFSGQPKAINALEFKALSSSAQIQQLSALAETKTPKEVWQFLIETYTGQSGTEGNIHDLAHLIGGIIYQKAGFGGLAICGSEFAFGCYHGFLDQAFSTSLDKISDAQTACAALGQGGPFASCIHGIGHGVASFYQTSDLKTALLTCQKLKSGTEYCYDGVFMEFERAAPLSLYSRANPYQPCDALEAEFGSIFSFACGRNQPTVLLHRFKFSFEQLIEVCLNSTSSEFRTACIDSLGFAVARSSPEPANIIASCQKIGVLEYVAKCAQTAAGELIFQEIPGWQSKAPQVCQSLDSGAADLCQQYLYHLIREYHRDVSGLFQKLGPGEDEDSYVQKTLGICYGIGGRDDCYQIAARILYDQFGLKKGLELLKQNEGHEEVYARCHEVTHYLSRAEYNLQRNISKVYAQCDSTCHGGCYHGTLEAYLKERQEDEAEIASEFAKVCGAESNYSKPIEYNECFHGLGHAAMFVTEMELIQSLKLCDKLTDPKYVERCQTGVFMENSSSSTSFDHQSKFIKADDPYYPCNSIEEKYRSVCWQYQSSYFSILTKQDWRKVAQMCLAIPPVYQDKCFKTIGTNQVGFTLSLKVMKEDCDLMPTENFKDICISGVVSSLSYRFVGDTRKIIEFCSLVDPQNKESCYKQFGTGAKDWVKDGELAKQECVKIPDPGGRAWCLSVI